MSGRTFLNTLKPSSGHSKILHTLIGKGSAALAAAVPYPGKATRISREGQRRRRSRY